MTRIFTDKQLLEMAVDTMKRTVIRYKDVHMAHGELDHVIQVIENELEKPE